MQSIVRQQQQQPQTDVRQHPRLRRSHSPLYNYTALWARDLLARGSNTSPNSTSSDVPLNSSTVHDRMTLDRRRWTRCVCVCFVVCLLVNVASSAFVFVSLKSARDVTDDALFQQFMNQEGSVDVLNPADRVSIQKSQKANLNPRTKDGSSPNPNATPTAIHFLLQSASSPGEEGVVTGWKDDNNGKYLEGVSYDDVSGKFHINISGVYQVYSQLSFKCPENKFVEFKQELKDETGTPLLDDVEKIDCSGIPATVPGHVSFMMSALPLQQGCSLRLWTNRPESLVRGDSLSVFGIFMLH